MKVLRAIITVGVVCSFGASLQAQLVDGIVAIVHDTPITRLELQIYTAPFANQLERQYGSEPNVLEQKLATARSESLEQLLERQLILHDYKTGGYSMPESYLDDIVQERINSTFGSRAKATQTLQAEGLTYEKYREQIRDRIIVEAMQSKHVSSDIIISPHKIEAYYLAHQDDYKVEAQVRLRTIDLIKSSKADDATVRQLAEDIRTKIKEGAAFSEMASVNSQGPQRSEGGERGWVERKDLRKELSDVAFSLKPGELSDVIDTPEACYLILVEGKRPAHVKPLRDVQEEIERTLANQEKSRLYKQYVNRLKKKTFVRYF